MENDIKEIEQVLYHCCHAVDRGEADAFVDLFHPDGVFVVTWEENGRHAGHGQIRQWVTNYHQTLRAAMKYLRHKITSPAIQVIDDCATAHSYLDVEALPESGDKVLVSVCRYEDKLVKYKGRWRLMEKVVLMDHLYTV